MEILTNFGIQPILLLAQIVNFLIILALLTKFFYKPITKVLDNRKKRIEESLKNADTIEKKLAETDEKIAKILEEARINSQNIIDGAKKEAERVYQEASLDAKKLTAEAVANAQDQIDKQRQEMQKQLEAETLTLIISVVKKVLGRSLNQKERSQLTDKAISDVTSQVQ